MLLLQYLGHNLSVYGDSVHTQVKKLSVESIRKALQTQGSDSHNCTKEFSEADVTSIRK